MPKRIFHHLECRASVMGRYSETLLRLVEHCRCGTSLTISSANVPPLLVHGLSEAIAQIRYPRI